MEKHTHSPRHITHTQVCNTEAHTTYTHTEIYNIQTHTQITHKQIPPPQTLIDIYEDPQHKHTHKYTHERRTDPEMHTHVGIHQRHTQTRWRSDSHMCRLAHTTELRHPPTRPGGKGRKSQDRLISWPPALGAGKSLPQKC